MGLAIERKLVSLMEREIPFRIPTNYIWLKLIIKSLIGISPEFMGIWTSIHQKMQKRYTAKPYRINLCKIFSIKKKQRDLLIWKGFQSSLIKTIQISKEKISLSKQKAATHAVHMKKCTLWIQYSASNSNQVKKRN